MSDEPSCRAPRASSSPSSRCCAPTALPSRRSRPPRSSQRSAARSARAWRTSGRPALATLAPPPERRATYDRLFDIHFLGSEALGAPKTARTTRSSGCRRRAAARRSRRCADEADESGKAATRTEALVERRFGAWTTSDALRRLAREAPARLPRRRGHRRMRARRGPLADLRRTLRDTVRNDGEMMRLARLKRRHAAAQAAAADRRLRLDEGAHGGQSAARACARAGGAERRDLHLRHAADPRHPALRLKRREQALAAAAHWSATGTAAPASAMRCRPSSRCRASAATRAAPPSSSSPTGWSAATCRVARCGREAVAARLAR